MSFLKQENEVEVVFPEGCFSTSTLITMADKSTKPICEMKVGDRIVAYDQDESCFQLDTVIDVFTSPIKSLIRIQLQNEKMIVCAP